MVKRENRQHHLLHWTVLGLSLEAPSDGEASSNDARAFNALHEVTLYKQVNDN